VIGLAFNQKKKPVKPRRAKENRNIEAISKHVALDCYQTVSVSTCSVEKTMQQQHPLG